MPRFNIKTVYWKSKDGFSIDDIAGFDLEEVEETKEWRPKENETFFFINDCCVISDTIYMPSFWAHIERVSNGNCFRTREEAERARDAIKELLKGMKK